MDASSPCHDLLSEFQSSTCDLKQLYVSHKLCSSNKNCTIEDSEVTELESSLCRVVNVQAVPLPIPGCIQASDWNEICHPGMGKFCEEFKIQDDNLSTEKVLNKCVSLPISRKPPLSSPVAMGGIEGIPCIKLHENDSSNNRVCSRSLSLPNPTKFVRSAIKGGREKEGVILPSEKLTVKWAPEVYDPPSSSVSHTVNSHNQHQHSSSRSNNKKHGKHKHKHKGKSSRGSNTDKKQHCKSICNSDNLRPISQATNDRVQHLNSFEQSSVNVKLVEFGAEQDSSNCGTSFLKISSLTKMRVSVAEAT